MGKKVLKLDIFSDPVQADTYPHHPGQTKTETEVM